MDILGKGKALRNIYNHIGYHPTYNLGMQGFPRTVYCPDNGHF
jgi:hypothetical protein